MNQQVWGCVENTETMETNFAMQIMCYLFHSYVIFYIYLGVWYNVYLLWLNCTKQHYDVASSKSIKNTKIKKTEIQKMKILFLHLNELSDIKLFYHKISTSTGKKYIWIELKILEFFYFTLDGENEKYESSV
jgi:hypothetical protein